VRGRVSAHVSLGERKPAPLPVMVASVFNRSRVDRASRSSRVTVNTSPFSSLPTARRNWAQSALARLAVSRIIFSAPAARNCFTLANRQCTFSPWRYHFVARARLYDFGSIAPHQGKQVKRISRNIGGPSVAHHRRLFHDIMNPLSFSVLWVTPGIVMLAMRVFPSDVSPCYTAVLGQNEGAVGMSRRLALTSFALLAGCTAAPQPIPQPTAHVDTTNLERDYFIMTRILHS
jgi:hypothetical protein